jgi:hypothetical protein
MIKGTTCLLRATAQNLQLAILRVPQSLARLLAKNKQTV